MLLNHSVQQVSKLKKDRNIVCESESAVLKI